MLFKKLFQVLVLGGVVAAGQTGCAAKAEEEAPKKKSMTSDAGTATASADAGKQAEGSGVQGW